MKVAIIGGGLIGQERIEAINNLIAEGVALEITYVIEPSIVLREKLQNKYKLNCFEDHKVVLSSDVDWIFI